VPNFLQDLPRPVAATNLRADRLYGYDLRRIEAARVSKMTANVFVMVVVYMCDGRLGRPLAAQRVSAPFQTIGEGRVF